MPRVMVWLVIGVVLSGCGKEASPQAPQADLGDLGTKGDADMAPARDMEPGLSDQGVDQGDLGGKDMAPAYPDPEIYKACAPYAVRGPYDVGVTTLMVDGGAVEVWYPAPAGAQAGRAPDVYDLRDWLPEDFRAKIPASEPTR